MYVGGSCASRVVSVIDFALKTDDGAAAHLLLRLVVADEAVDAGLDEDEAELGVLVLAVRLEVLADGYGLFDEVPEILGDLGRETCRRIVQGMIRL